MQACSQDLNCPLKDNQQVSLEGEDGSIVQRLKTSSFKVLKVVILEPMKHSLYLEFLFPKLDDGRSRVLNLGGGGFICG